MAPLIGYYAHHHGAGHLERARLVAALYPGRMDVLSSLADPLVTVRLASDIDGGPLVDVGAHGRLHFAPRHNRRLTRRASRILSWIAATRPALVVVDASVEVAALVRLAGVPVVYVRQHGIRTDEAHRLAYDLADALVAPYPDWAEDVSASPAVRARTTYVGGFSRFDGLPPTTQARDPDEVVVVAGPGPTGLTADRLATLAAHGTRRWTVLGIEPPGRHRTTKGARHARGPQAGGQLAGRVGGPPDGTKDGSRGPVRRHEPRTSAGDPLAGRLRFEGRVADPWPYLCRAGVVVASAEHSLLCEAAAANAPTVAVAEDRPFAEQEHAVQALAAPGAITPAPSLAIPTGWEAALRQATDADPRWRNFADGHGARRMATVLADLAESLAAAEARR